MKILIIGQAPAAVNQTVPYDTTMLYEWLDECGVSKEAAQSMFDFEAVYNSFPGHDAKGGHLKPSLSQMNKHWADTLQLKIEMADKVWVLGTVAKEYIDSKPKTWSCNMGWLYTIHPSKRNADLFNRQRTELLARLKKFIS